MTPFKGTALACVAIATAWMRSAGAFDAETHALITYKAYQESVLVPNDPSQTLIRWGLDRLDVPTPFNAYWQATSGASGPVSYYDNTGTYSPTAYPRQPNDYERCQMEDLAKVAIPNSTTGYFDAADPMLSGAKVAFLPVQNWLMRGVLREDDVSALLYKTIAKEECGQPDGDPYGDLTRVFNHFYDPIHDNGLSIGTKSIDWAMGYVDSFATSLVVDTNRRNHFTYVDARENLWRALTGERGIATLPYTAAAHAADAQERLYRWATTFRALGDVVHLLQDGASPQHVRNDIHSPIGTSQEQQAFEGFTNARVRGSPIGKTNAYVRGFYQDTPDKGLPKVPLANSVGPYPVVSFTTPVRFYTTRLKTDSASVLPDHRFGMMDYANRSFFTGGTLPGMSGNIFQRPRTPVDATNGYTQSQVPCVLSSAQGNSWRHDLKCTHFMHAVDDSVAPSYADVLPTVDGPVQFTQPPLVAFSAFTLATCPPSQCRYTVGLEELETMANLGVPRAIGYTAGLLNYFLRGKLTVSAPADKTIGVLNQGARHTMNAQGYPCVGTATTDGCAIFGFQYIRVNVVNGTTPITESGTAAVVPQNLSTTAVGDVNDPNFHGPYLVAVAKYHRNTCYKPDLTGQRVQSYAPVPQQNIVDPICGSGQVVRTAYQEVSVSKSIAATATALNGTSATEFKFDFTADPIPVNATDLFIQVVYRGPMGDATLGQESDAIAVGTMDVREPTFVAFWNNTDYYWNAGWHYRVPAVYPNEPVRDFWICGSSAPPKLLFEYYGVPGAYAMNDPILSSNSPGQVRLGIIYPPPVGASQFIARGTPVADPLGDNIPIPVRSTGNGGNYQQANKENVLAVTLTTPSPNCGSGLPALSEYWCNDPVQKRRGQIFGRIAQPLYLLVTDDAGDVDIPPLPAFAGTLPRSGGTNRFNTDTTLIACPGQPTALSDPDYPRNMRTIELIEEAHALGVPVGDEK